MPPPNQNANAPQAQDSGIAERDSLAFQIFCQRVASHPVKRGGEHEALDAFKKAEAFLAVRKKLASGEVKVKEVEGIQLADCCAPNLPRTHPLNLVAKVHTNRKSGVQTHGDLARVSKINDWLYRNPTPETNPDELVNRLGAAFPELGWDLPTINVARAVFPNYCPKN